MQSHKQCIAHIEFYFIVFSSVIVTVVVWFLYYVLFFISLWKHCVVNKLFNLCAVSHAKLHNKNSKLDEGRESVCFSGGANHSISGHAVSVNWQFTAFANVPAKLIEPSYWNNWVGVDWEWIPKCRRCFSR